jgi:hypothetical protein
MDVKMSYDLPFAKQLLSAVNDQFDKTSEELGHPITEKYLRQLGVIGSAYSAIIAEELGEVFHGDTSVIKEIEVYSDTLNSLGMANVMIAIGSGTLKHISEMNEDSDITADDAVDNFLMAMEFLGYARFLNGMSVTDMVRKHISRQNSKAAKAGHRETEQIKDEARQFWLTTIDRALSNQKAADILIKRFPLEHRTLAGYVAEFKRELIEKV